MIQMGQKKSQILQKIKCNYKNYLFYLTLCIVFTGGFFGFEFVEKHSKEYYIALKEANVSIDENDFWLDKIKDTVKGTQLYSNYSVANKKKKISENNFKQAKKNEKVRRFKTKRIFLKEFGVYLCFGLYVLINLFRSYYKERQNGGIKVFHSYFLAVCIFFIFWAIQPFSDVSKVSYYFISGVVAVVFLASFYYIAKYNDYANDRLKRHNYELAKIKIKNASPEEKEHVLNEIERIVKSE